MTKFRDRIYNLIYLSLEAQARHDDAKTIVETQDLLDRVDAILTDIEAFYQKESTCKCSTTAKST